jgi:predicted phosphodiesterase
MSEFTEAAKALLADIEDKNAKDAVIGAPPAASSDPDSIGEESYFEISSRSGKARFVSPAFPDGKPLTNTELLEFYSLDPTEWDVATLRVSSGNFWFRETEGADTVTRFGHRYSGEFVSKIAVEGKAKTLKWDPIVAATPVKITYKRPASSKRGLNKRVKTAIILPDPQIGFGLTTDDRWFTTHDPNAMDLALQIADLVQPDVIINLGDTLDSAEWGKYLSAPVFARTMQRSLDTAHTFLAMQREICDQVVLLDGNHDTPRVEKNIIANVGALFGVRRANTDEEPVYSLQHLLRLDELGIEWRGTYPNGTYHLRDDICVHHGEKLSARDQAQKGRIVAHTVQGHIHRTELQTRSFDGPAGEIIQTWHMSPGTLAKVTGEVPSFGSSLSTKGMPMRRVEDWQQGLLVLHYEDAFRGHIEPRLIEIKPEGTALYDQKVFEVGLNAQCFAPPLESV